MTASDLATTPCPWLISVSFRPMKNLATTLAVALSVASGNAGHDATASEGGDPALSGCCPAD